jgi:hypothetical protein
MQHTGVVGRMAAEKSDRQGRQWRRSDLILKMRVHHGLHKWARMTNANMGGMAVIRARKSST